MNDGSTRKIDSISDLIPGAIVRQVNHDGTIAPFSDAIIISRSGDIFCLTRPYAFVSGVRTSCATPLFGNEMIDVSFYALQEHYVLVLTSRGHVYTMVCHTL